MKKLLPKNKTNKKIVVIHPSANNAFNFYNRIPGMFNPGVNKDLINKSLFEKYNILQVINSRDKIEIITGFDSPFFKIDRIDLENHIVISIDDDTSEYEIEKLAWNSILLKIIRYSIDSKNLSEFRDLINEMVPRPILIDLIGGDVMTQSYLAKSTSRSRSTIAKQRKK